MTARATWPKPVSSSMIPRKLPSTHTIDLSKALSLFPRMEFTKALMVALLIFCALLTKRNRMSGRMCCRTVSYRRIKSILPSCSQWWPTDTQYLHQPGTIPYSTISLPCERTRSGHALRTLSWCDHAVRLPNPLFFVIFYHSTRVQYSSTASFQQYRTKMEIIIKVHRSHNTSADNIDILSTPSPKRASDL